MGGTEGDKEEREGMKKKEKKEKYLNCKLNFNECANEWCVAIDLLHKLFNRKFS